MTTRFTARVQVFDHRISRDEDAERAEPAVQEYLNTIPDDLAECFPDFVADMNGEEHDPEKSKRWAEVEREAYLIAKRVATQDWLCATQATEIHVEIEPEAVIQKVGTAA